jgi:hypothetical protein
MFEMIAQVVTAEAAYAFDKMSDSIHMVACGFRERLDQLEEKMRPDEASVEFGLALKSDAGNVLMLLVADPFRQLCMCVLATILCYSMHPGCLSRVQIATQEREEMDPKCLLNSQKEYSRL